VSLQLALSDLMRTDTDGRGFHHILALGQLMRKHPKNLCDLSAYGCCSERTFEELPSVGDPDKPKLGSFFFDGKHICCLMIAPKALVDKVEQVARRSAPKGVGV